MGREAGGVDTGAVLELILRSLQNKTQYLEKLQHFKTHHTRYHSFTKQTEPARLCILKRCEIPTLQLRQLQASSARLKPEELPSAFPLNFFQLVIAVTPDRLSPAFLKCVRAVFFWERPNFPHRDSPLLEFASSSIYFQIHHTDTRVSNRPPEPDPLTHSVCVYFTLPICWYQLVF